MLNVTGLTKTFPSQSKPVVKHFNLHLSPAEILFLIGPSGSGKSTILRLIANLDRRDQGALTFDGKTPAQLGFTKWRANIMYVPQSRIGLNGTPNDLLIKAYGFQSRSSHALYPSMDALVQTFVRIAESVGLTREDVNHPWSELSGGMFADRLRSCVKGQSQRASLAVFITLKPKILLLDEPTSSCDSETTLLVEDAIKSSGIAAIWVSHDVGQPKRVGGRVQTMEPLNHKSAYFSHA